MRIPSFLDQRVDLLRFLERGVAIGVAGGVAEIAVVAAYTRAAGGSVSDIAAGVANAVHLDAASAVTGLLVHMGLAMLLGIALMAVAAWAGFFEARSAGSLYATMFAALGLVWAVNFLLVLPWLSPTFLTMLPLPLTLLSKLSFGASAAALLHWMSPAARDPITPAWHRSGGEWPVSRPSRSVA